MVCVYYQNNERIEQLHESLDPEKSEKFLWIDLFEPTEGEVTRAEELLGITIPSKDRMQEIEPSSRFYEENGILYMTATIVSKIQQTSPETHSVTFVLTPTHLVTIRYIDPVPFETFHKRVGKLPKEQRTPELLLMGLLEAIVGRLADVLEWIGEQVDDLSKSVFTNAPNPADDSNAKPARTDYQKVLQNVGRQGDLTFKTRESLASLVRLVTNLEQTLEDNQKGSPEFKKRLKKILKDVNAINDYAMFISGNISFLLDGTLGIIGIEQNVTIKIFTIIGVVLMPPTLVASIYGMNFAHMPPEIQWHYGFYFALVLMLISAFAPYNYFKRKGWL